jgi:hypothetical protein
MAVDRRKPFDLNAYSTADIAFTTLMCRELPIAEANKC